MTWQVEQNLACQGCGVPRDEGWVVGWPDEKQREMQQHAQESVKARLCVFCRARQNHEHQSRDKASARPAELHGIHFVVER